MRLKAADDKAKRIQFLEDLAASSTLDTRQKELLRKELDRTRKGIDGERSAAHYLDNYIGDSKNSVLIHDLRISVNGEVAQIDHLLMNRSGIIILFETKHFGGNVDINDQGEFTVYYGSSARYGIPSPVEQSRRHENVLNKLFPTIGIEPRVGGRFTYYHLVLMNPSSTISRPKNKKIDTSHIMKADMFPEWHKKWVESDLGPLEMVRHLSNLRSSETLQSWGEKLVEQHVPTDPMALPGFLSASTLKDTLRVSQPQTEATVASDEEHPLARKLICAHCNAKISYAEGRFCWGNERRFGGLQYCRDHQAQFN